MSKQEALSFDFIPDSVYPYIDEQDCHSCLLELKENDLIKLYVDGGFILKNSAIVYMENRFKKGLSEIVDFLTSLMP